MTTECFGTRYFMSWLAEQNASLIFSAYKTGSVFLVGPSSSGGLTVGRASFTRGMGIAARGDTLFLGTAAQIWKFDRIRCRYDGFTAAYLPRVGFVTGDVDIHEIVLEDTGRLVFVNTLYSCLSTLCEANSFSVVWKPPFISKLAPEDRCHLNGVALRDGKARYVTLVAQADVMGQWREQRHDGGIIMDIETNEVIAEGLSMPHSPRWHAGRLWLHNSGTGHFGYIDERGAFIAVCFCPGYLRGLSFIDKYAVVGLSRLRESSAERSLRDLELERTLAEQKLKARCGIYVIDLETGNIEQALTLEGEVMELFDVAVLPGVTHTDILDFAGDHINRIVTFKD